MAAWMMGLSRLPGGVHLDGGVDVRGGVRLRWSAVNESLHQVGWQELHELVTLDGASLGDCAFPCVVARDQVTRAGENA